MNVYDDKTAMEAMREIVKLIPQAHAPAILAGVIVAYAVGSKDFDFFVERLCNSIMDIKKDIQDSAK